ncbi:MAG TPA: NifU family protein [Flavobacteriaceae bacterium]|nr:NifU family protein [Flavobacteriaceae bacterium]
MHKITIKNTSNPSIVKFESSQFLLKNERLEFANIDEAKDSPLAQQLFYLPFVKKVYIASNFVAVEKYNIVEWEAVAEEVAAQIEAYLNNNGVITTKTLTGKKVPVTVYAESTPNPAAMKFVANKKLVTQTHEFTSIEEAKSSPLATRLFYLPFVKNVFIDENFVSITKYDVTSWEDVAMEIRTLIKEFIEEGNDAVSAPAPVKNTAAQNPEPTALDDTSREIISILDEYVKPAVASDGGNIQFESYNPENKTVKVILQGACSGCPSSTFTLKNGIESILKEMLKDKVAAVDAVNG